MSAGPSRSQPELTAWPTASANAGITIAGGVGWTERTSAGLSWPSFLRVVLELGRVKGPLCPVPVPQGAGGGERMKQYQWWAYHESYSVRPLTDSISFNPHNSCVRETSLTQCMDKRTETHRGQMPCQSPTWWQGFRSWTEIHPVIIPLYCRGSSTGPESHLSKS